MMKDPIRAGYEKAKAEDEARKQREAMQRAFHGDPHMTATEILERQREAERLRAANARQNAFYGWDLGADSGSFSFGGGADPFGNFAYRGLDEQMRQMFQELLRKQAEQARGTFHGQDGFHPRYSPPPQIEDCFKVLGVAPGCTEKEVITAFRKLAPAAHPDTGGTNEKFQRLNSAKTEALRRVKTA